MITLLIIIPLLGSLAAWTIPDNRQRPLVLPLASGLHLIIATMLIAKPPPPSLNGWIFLDPLGKLVLLGITILFFFCAIYSVGYLAYRQERSNRTLCMGLLLCLSAMSLATVSQHLGLLWLAIETTTLTMAPLIYFNRNARSIEATWKYMMICSIGIAMALLGIYFLAYATVVSNIKPTLLLAPLLAGAKSLSPAWLNGAFIFLLVGFGTKIGLAPLHTWKPDAYGEAPGLVGALLAGGLVNCGFLGICRIYQVCAASSSHFYLEALTALGFLSMITAAIFVLKQADFKRVLAYSSVEHVGFLAIGLGMGKGALYGTLFHLLNNSFIKGVLFLTAANIHRSYKSKRVERVRGVIERLPWSGWLFMAAFFAVTGSPPFSSFISEFMVISSIFDSGNAAAGIAIAVFFGIIFIGMTTTILPVLSGRGDSKDLDDSGYRDKALTIAPPLMLMLITLILGIWIPAPLQTILSEAAVMLGAKP